MKEKETGYNSLLDSNHGYQMPLIRSVNDNSVSTTLITFLNRISPFFANSKSAFNMIN